MGFCGLAGTGIPPFGAAGFAGDDTAGAGTLVEPVAPKFVADSGVGATDFVNGDTFAELPIAVGQGKVLAASPPIGVNSPCFRGSKVEYSGALNQGRMRGIVKALLTDLNELSGFFLLLIAIGGSSEAN